MTLIERHPNGVPFIKSKNMEAFNAKLRQTLISRFGKTQGEEALKHIPLTEAVVLIAEQESEK
jgi:hypothetical protein